jgi:ABC-2 type transport system permease protein
MNELAGTRTIIRLILRRDRIGLAIWLALSVLPPFGVAAGFAKLYPTADALRGFASECMSNPAIVAVLGPIFAPTLGGMTAWRTGGMGMIAAGIPSLLLVLRHTRGEEETGRLELLEGSGIGRYAPLTAVLIVVMVSNLILAGLISAALIGLGLPAAGSIAMGLSWAGAGWMFAAIGAVAAQTTLTTRAADGLALAVFGGSFFVRMAGDSGGERGQLAWLSWLSPLGWTRLTRPFAREQWWVFIMVLGFTGATVAAAYALRASRELGTGLLRARSRAAETSRSLSTTTALAWRLQRGMLFGWIAGLFALGLLLGAVANTLSTILDTPAMDHWLAQMGVPDPSHAFLRLVIYTLGQAISAYAILAAMVLRDEETTLHAEPILSTAVSRTRWAASHLLFAVAGPAIVLASTGAAVGLAIGTAEGRASQEIGAMVALTMRILPAVWVMAGITLLVFGIAPRYAAIASWLALAAFLLLELGWELRQFGQWTFYLSPFAYVHWSIANVSASSVLGLTLTAAILVSAGLVALGHRDIGW